MTRKIQILFIGITLVIPQLHSQTIKSIHQSIDSIIQSKNMTVGVAINGIKEQDSLYINGEKHFPMQSVFKFPIALATLAEIDKGKFSYDTKIQITEKELLPNLWSPIREKYPKGASLSIAEIMQYTVGASDNVGCDALLKLFEKPQMVEKYFAKLGFEDIAIEINEETMQNNWDLQFQNWTTPKEANRILRKFYKNENHLLSQKSCDLIWEIMKSSETGLNRLRGQLPKETIVAHKTGWSGVNKDTGITAATNDIGVAFLPNGEYYFISVFITESHEDLETNERVISNISKLAWDYFTSK